MSAVGRYYDERASVEWARLDEAWLEFAVTMAMIERFAPERAEVLDVGGGPGRYAIELARRGHTVDLVDLSAGCVAFAEQQAAEQGVALRSARCGDARHLETITPGGYDVALVLGPLYHLVARAERERAIEAVRATLRPGGVAFFAMLSTYAPAYFAMRNLDRSTASGAGLSESIGARHHVVRPDGRFFTESIFMHPEAIAEEMAAAPLDHVTTFGAESIFAQSQDRLRASEPAIRSRALSIAVDHCEDVAGVAGSEHIVWVGRTR
ncbi:MAG: class I SAM-dependent methyltransferase [Actinomycetota bacterium]